MTTKDFKNKLTASISSAALLTGAQYLELAEVFDSYYERTSKMNFGVSSKTQQQFSQLSHWEKLFVENFYGKNGNDIVLERPTDKETRYNKVRQDVESELKRLYALADSKEYFEISTEDNKFLEREYESEIKALESRGQATDAEMFKDNKGAALKELAEKFGETQQAEYEHIVNFIKSTNFEPAFKVLMLRETLLQTYKQITENDETKTIIEKRIPHKTLSGHMTLNQDVLSTIYNNVDKYSNFANLYFAGIAISNKTTSISSEITLDGVDTFGKGKWLKFEGKKSNSQKYIENAKRLSALVQNTPWCTKQLASSQLEDGDFFVFVDNEGNPHIAVKMHGNEIDEVRGIKNGNAQELEDDYREVAVEFLTKNKNIVHGKEWLEKEKWNERLIAWKNGIENNEEFSDKDIDLLLDDAYSFRDYRAHFDQNSNKKKLLEVLPKLSKQFARRFGCKENEIVLDANATSEEFSQARLILSDANFSDSTQIQAMKIGGYANFYNSPITNLGNLQSIGGDASFRDSQITNIGNLQNIGGLANFSFSQITNLGNLQSIGGDAYFNNSQITSLGNLQSIGGGADFSDSQITSLGNLQSIGGGADFSDSQITDLGNLQSIGGNTSFRDSQITDLDNLHSIGGDADFRYSHISDLGKLQSIGRDAYFYSSPITDLGKLQSIGRDAYFYNSPITDLGNLQSIGGDTSFRDSKITNLGKLQTIGGEADFRNSKITDFGQLREIRGQVSFGDNESGLILASKFDREFIRDEKTGVYYRKREFILDASKDGGRI